KWNFLDKNGDSLFNEPFDFTFNFYLKTAIAKKKTGWGVVTKDTICISFVYASIERLKEFGDTIFKVKLPYRGKIYYDSTLKHQLFNRFAFEKKNELMTLFSSKQEFNIYNANNELIAEQLKNVKLSKYGYYIVKIKKDRIIYDVNGNQIGQSFLAPLDFISENLFIVEKNNKKGILNLNSDTLLPLLYKELIHCNDYIIAQKDEATYLFHQDLTLIKKIKSGHFLIDLNSNKWLIINGQKITIFNEKSEKISNWSINEKVINFYNNHIYSDKGIIYNLEGEKILTVVNFIDVNYYDDAYISLQDSDKKWHLYTKDWKELTDASLNNRKINYHGDHVFSMTNKKGFIVYDFLNNLEFTLFSEVSGNFTNKYICVKKDDYYFYIDRQFIDVFNRHFKNATPFINDFASIATENGWSIIGKDGFPKSLPSFPEIKQINKNAFETSKKPLYGLYNSAGKLILEVKYEKITILPNKLIQTIFEGEIHYFDISGKKIY
ncbi:MAG: hypothetical protein HYR91_08760, partial [Flavobacteriia bacterium]|nr:hypothetical protein [Flavobacteriia bacterium]